jgi:hypothetical protein
MRQQQTVEPVPELHTFEIACTGTPSNANWEYILPRPITIDRGDQISIVGGVLNQGQLTGGNIEVATDITIALEFGFYVVNGIQFCGYSLVNDMQYYFAPEWVGQYPGVWSGGDTFTTDNDVALAVSGLQLGQTINFATAGNKTIQALAQGGGSGSQLVVTMTTAGVPNGADILLGNPGSAQEPNMNNNFIPQDVLTDGELYTWHLVDPSTPSGFSPIIERIEIQLQAGSYTPQQIQTIITERLSNTNGQDLQGDDGAFFQLSSGSRFLLNATTQTLASDSYWLSSYTNSAWTPDTVRRFRYQEQAVGPAPLAPNDTIDPTYFVGASQVALDYDDISQTFQWSFLHTPMTDPATSAISNALYRSTFKYNAGVDQYVGPLKYQTRQSGVFLTKLEPEGFWSNLGFSLGETLVDITDGVSTTEVRNKSTDNQLGLSTILSRSPQGNSIVVNQNWNNPPSTAPTTLPLQYLSDSNIVPLKAQRTYSASNNGLYFISLNLGLVGNYSDNRSVYGNISGVVSKYFQANDFISITGEGIIPYIHNGDSTILSSIEVRILDSNKQEATGLLSRSNIILRVVKGG